MAAYVIADFEITDLEGMKEYGSRVVATLKQYGGRYLIRAGLAEIVEGDWSPHRLAILEFESVEQAKRWYHSAEYTAIKSIRHRSANTNVIIVPGIEEEK